MEEHWRRACSGSYGQPVSGSTTATSGTILSISSTTSSDPLLLERPLVVEENAEGLLEQERTMQQLIRALVEEFCAGGHGQITAPDRWLSKLNVAWLLHLVELDASARGIYISRQQQLRHLVQTWIPALQVIIASIWLCLSGFSSQEQEEATVAPPAASEFARFFKATLLKMFTFVHAVAALAPLNVDDPSSGQQQHIFSSSVGTAWKLRALLHVRDALSMASEQLMMRQSTSIAYDLGYLLYAQLGELDKPICNTTEQIKNVVMSSLDNDSCWDTTQMALQSSPDIHNVTRSVINCIKVLSTDWWSMDAITSKATRSANYVPNYEHMSTLIMKLIHSLEEHLARVSQSFADQRLRFIFLMNNSYFICHQLMAISTLDRHLMYFSVKLYPKINRYIESYLQVSWEPVLKCLHDPTLHCFTFTRNSPLSKFESKFQATYSAQKLWKVPDTELRKRMRGAIIEKVISGFTEYLEDNNRIIPRVTPQELEEMLQELFEG